MSFLSILSKVLYIKYFDYQQNIIYKCRNINNIYNNKIDTKNVVYKLRIYV